MTGVRERQSGRHGRVAELPVGGPHGTRAGAGRGGGRLPVCPRNLPAADDGIQELVHLAAEPHAAAEGKHVHAVGVNRVQRVVIRNRAPFARIPGIGDDSPAPRAGVFVARGEIDGLAERIVEIELQVIGEPLAHGQLGGVVIAAPDGASCGQRAELVGEHRVRAQNGTIESTGPCRQYGRWCRWWCR